MERPAPVGHFRFDLYEVNLAAAELRRNGRRIPIQDKPLRLLVLLAQRPGEVVARADIQEHLWPPDTTVVFEDGLNTAVKKLREALHDNSDKPRYIETVRGRGYRFLGQIQPIAPAQELTPPRDSGAIPIPPSEPAALIQPEPPPPPQPPPRPSRNIAAIVLRRPFAATGILVAAGVCIAATAGLSLHRQNAAAAAEAARPHTIAVLPIANLTGDPQRGYLADGETVDLIARLGDENPSAVHVIGRASAMSLRNSPLTARQIGQTLSADYLLEGTFRGDSNQIHLTAQLIRAADQTQVWTRNYIGTLAQLQEFENDIADRSAESLPGVRGHIAPPQQTVVTAEAHDFYLRGLAAIGQRSREGFEAAMLNFGNAIQKEPRYAEAYAELAVTYNLMGQYNWMRQDEARSQGRAAALQALALDPTLAEARAALGFSYWFYDWDNERARQELTSASDREPNNVDAHHWLAMVLVTSGRAQQSETQMRSAIALDPASPILRTNLGWVHYMEGRFPLAVEEMSAVTKQNPNFIPAHFKLIPAAFLMGDQRRAWQESETMLQIDDHKELLNRASLEYGRSGYVAALKTMVAFHDDTYYVHETDVARDLIFTGDSSGALRVLEDGLKHHDSWMIFVPVDPAFAPLREDPRFRHIVESVQLGQTHPAAN